MPNEVTTSTKSLMAVQKNYIDSIGKGLESIIGKMDAYQAVCGYNILNEINLQLAKNGLNHTAQNIDKESINNAIKYAVIYRLNSDNREVFVIIRNEKREKETGGRKEEYWIKKVEIKPQYKGQLKILSSYGRNIKRVYPEWIVREGDDFKYATFKGVSIEPPEWTPKSYDGKVLRVIVPIEYSDGFIDYRIAERESVATNIKAQIKQTLMNNKDKQESARVLELIKDYTLDQLLGDKDIAKYVNDTYTGLSAEEMIITKLVLNATKRVQIDYEKALPRNGGLARELNEKTYDNADVYTKSHKAEQLLVNAQTPLELEGPIEEEVTTKAPESLEALFEE